MITDELREYAEKNECKSYCKLLTDIADRIDAEYQKAIREINNLADASVILPVDADGEYIHIGDMMEGYGKTIEVVELRYGRSGWVIISRDGNGYADTFAFAHHHKPTVEDVLREFAEKITDSQIPDVHPTYEEAIAEYAQKLQLREA